MRRKEGRGAGVTETYEASYLTSTPLVTRTSSSYSFCYLQPRDRSLGVFFVFPLKLPCTRQHLSFLLFFGRKRLNLSTSSRGRRRRRRSRRSVRAHGEHGLNQTAARSEELPRRRRRRWRRRRRGKKKSSSSNSYDSPSNNYLGEFLTGLRALLIKQQQQEEEKQRHGDHSLLYCMSLFKTGNSRVGWYCLDSFSTVLEVGGGGGVEQQE